MAAASSTMKKDTLTLNLSQPTGATLKAAAVQSPAPRCRYGTPGLVPPDGPLTSLDLPLLKLTSPELEHLVIQYNGLVTTTRQARNSFAPM